jgi:uncharacterized RmlC-like cupin family protein
MITEYSPICIVSPSEFDAETAQTSGSTRLAAIAPHQFVQSAMWGGLFKVEPGARTGVHHHGKQETVKPNRLRAVDGIGPVRAAS